jgi:hypothetical protein
MRVSGRPKQAITAMKAFIVSITDNGLYFSEKFYASIWNLSIRHKYVLRQPCYDRSPASAAIVVTVRSTANAA